MCFPVEVLCEFRCVAVVTECLLVLVSYCEISTILSNIALIAVGAG